MSVLIVSFRTGYIIYKSPRKEEKSNTDSHLFVIWLPEAKIIVNVEFSIFTSSPNTVLKAAADYSCLLSDSSSHQCNFNLCFSQSQIKTITEKWMPLRHLYPQCIHSIKLEVYASYYFKRMLKIRYCKISLAFQQISCAQVKKQNKYK